MISRLVIFIFLPGNFFSNMRIVLALYNCTGRRYLNITMATSGMCRPKTLMQHLLGCRPVEDFPDSPKGSSNVAKALQGGL